MGEQSILTWNIPNFVSVGLMVLLLAALLSFAVKSFKTSQAA
jgi:hypothetical protein